MLPQIRKIQRLLFGSVLSKNKSFRSDNLLLIVKKVDITNITKFSFVVPKKVVKKAYKRNLIKRRGFSVIKNEITKIKNGFICVFFIKKDIYTLHFNKFTTEVVNLLKKSDIYKSK